MIRILLFCIVVQFTGSVFAQDYEREQRWANEIVPDLVVGEAVNIDAASGRAFLGLYAKGGDSKLALVIVHGIGVHPDHGVIGVLRVKLADLGYTTLSIQMPVLAREKMADDYYPAVFPDASDRIGKAGAWLRAKGHRSLVLVSHSMGSWMANVYLDQAADAPYAAWICMGLTGGFRTRIAGINWPMLNLKMPILDVYGENDLPPSVNAAARRARSIADIANAKQIRIAGADHFYAKRENSLVEEIDTWLKSLPSQQR
jgi:pimeloyl-ACP methyl ester carboxylesterase